MRIAIVGNSAESMLNFRGSLITSLIEQKNEVLAFCPDYSVTTSEKVRGLGAVPVHYKLGNGGMRPIADLRSVLGLIRAFQKYRPDAVLSYFVKPAIYGTLAASLTRVRTRIALVEGLGYGFGQYHNDIKRRLLSYFIKLLLYLSLSRADKVLVLNEEDKALLEDDCYLGRRRVLNIGGIGVELEKFPFVEARENVTKFAMAARLIEEKGVREYYEAARTLRGEGCQAEFVLLGGMSDNPSALSLEEVTSWARSGAITWPGQVDEIGPWLAEADVFVLPSYYREGVPRSIQEAMAVGRAIITTDHVGCRDTVESGLNGVLVGIKDLAQLVAAMRVFLDTPGLAKKMGRESRRIAEERFNARKVDSMVADLLTRES